MQVPGSHVNHKNDTSTLATALLEAQQTMHGVSKTGRNQQQGWSFVTVEDVTRACRECLTSAGLTAVYRLTTDATADTTTLAGYLEVTHAATGEQLRLPMPWPIERSGPQARRAAFSYARKQALVELLLVAEPEDPETTAPTSASKPATSKPAKPRRSTDPGERSGPPAPTEKQLKYLHTLLGQHGWNSRESALAYLAAELGREITSSKDLSAAEVSEVIDRLKATPKAARSGPADEPPDDPWSTEQPAAAP